MAASATYERLVAAATNGDAAAFSALVERHRAELQVHAYRMLGSLEDAQDAVQDALLRAWRSRATYDGRSTFRAWLYRITTNACLRILERRPRRLRALRRGPRCRARRVVRCRRPTFPGSSRTPIACSTRAPSRTRPLVARETIELAFLAAIQHLPPRQRAVLILRDALDWSANETAAVLEMSVAAANSALQRARATMKERLPAGRLEWATAADAEEAERSLLQTYMEAWERHDERQLVSLLREDVRMAMPPHPTWYEGREAVAAFLAERRFRARRGSAPVRADAREQAAGVRRLSGRRRRRHDRSRSTCVEIESGLVTDMHFFIYPELFPAFGLPDTLR